MLIPPDPETERFLALECPTSRTLSAEVQSTEVDPVPPSAFLQEMKGKQVTNSASISNPTYLLSRQRCGMRAAQMYLIQWAIQWDTKMRTGGPR